MDKGAQGRNAAQKYDKKRERWWMPKSKILRGKKTACLNEKLGKLGEKEEFCKTEHSIYKEPRLTNTRQRK